ncbi:hypothetical protein [Paracoccus shanxieyensis]|uniref:Uncharacterized protein n=1 Tax=Paracoccus shanxieyensis TaxID=2675752 RepID=A0A6L6J245_9RHOB|nr:hypothetical protein [Paracoccus shanxieyensis]MTH66623.1 hypothetical protein [Paracoccus shanxieyensis]MTH89872.1 hypothetical protein [Paracoccus shanxieyensis]
MPSDLELAIAKLPVPVAALFRELHEHPDFSCAALKIQMTVHFRGQKVGGLNRTTSEWYFSKVFVADHGGGKVPERFGFTQMLKRPDHEYWGRTGAGATEAFRSALSEMTKASL